MTDMVTADTLMVTLIGKRRPATPEAVPERAVPDRPADDADAKVARARSRDRILLVHRTLARRRKRVIATRRLP